jgi:hypothetical protein
MAWTTPRTWISGELVKEDDLNTHVRDNLLVLKTSIDDTGKIRALSSTYLANTSGMNLTGIAKLATDNVFTGKNTFDWYLKIPIGPNRWAT